MKQGDLAEAFQEAITDKLTRLDELDRFSIAKTPGSIMASNLVPIKRLEDMLAIVNEIERDAGSNDREEQGCGRSLSYFLGLSVLVPYLFHRRKVHLPSRPFL
jgi:hypothetical protein